MTMNDGTNVGPGSIDLRVNKAFQVEWKSLRIDRIAVQIEFDQILGGYQLRCERSRHDEAVRRAIVPGADVTETIQHTMLRENPVCSDQIFDKLGIRVHQV